MRSTDKLQRVGHPSDFPGIASACPTGCVETNVMAELMLLMVVDEEPHQFVCKAEQAVPGVNYPSHVKSSSKLEVSE